MWRGSPRPRGDMRPSSVSRPTRASGGPINLENRRAHLDRAYKDNKGKLTLGLPKKREVRSVPAPVFLVGNPRDLIGDRSPDALLFTAPRGGPTWLRDWRPRIFNKAVQDAGLGG